MATTEQAREKLAAVRRRPLPQPVLLIGVGVGLGSLIAYQSTGYDRFMLSLWLAGLLVLGTFFFMGSRALPRIARADLLIPLALVLGFAPLYLAGLYEWPVQVNADEIAIMLFADRHADLAGSDPFGLSEYLGHPILLFWVFGNLGDMLGGVTLEHMRLLHGLVGLAVIAAAYGLFRQLASRRTALVAACLLGLTHSLFMISRMAMRESTAVLLEAIALALLLRGLRHGHAFATFSGGVVAGLGFYVYFPSRATFFLWLAFLGVLALAFRSYVQPKEVGRQAAIAAAGFLLVAGPVAIAGFKAPPVLNLQQRQALLIFEEAREVQKDWVFASSVAEGYKTNVRFGLGAFNNERVDRANAYPNDAHGFLDPLTGVLLWIGVGIVAYSLFRRRGPPWPLFFLGSFLVLWLAFAFLINKAPNYPRLLITLPFVAYFAAQGALGLARLIGRAVANGSTRIETRTATATTVAIVAIVGLWNLSIAWDFVQAGRQSGDDIGSTGRYVAAHSEPEQKAFYMATNDTPAYRYYVWGWPEIWQQRLQLFAPRDRQIGSIIEPGALRGFVAQPPFAIFMNQRLWAEARTDLESRYPGSRIVNVTSDGRLLVLEVPA